LGPPPVFPPPSPARGDRERAGLRLAVLGLLWALVLLAGDPIVALQAGLLSLLAVAVDRWPRRRASTGQEGAGAGGRFTPVRGLSWLATATLLGSLVALPQYVEMARILPYSYRFQAFSPRQALLASWDPRQVVEWLLPFFFGRPQLNYWGYRFSGDEVPLFFSMFPGVLALSLALVAGRPRARGHLWAWLGVGGGLFVVLGSFNPAVALLARLPGLQLLRFPIKFWLPVALGAALLVGIGFDRCSEPAARRNLVRALLLLVLLYVAFAAFLVRFPDGVEQWIGSVMKQPQRPDRAHQVRLNWLAQSLVQGSLAGLYLALVAGARRGLALAGAGALALHAASQLFLLAPLYATDLVSVYREPPPLLDVIAADEVIVHGDIDNLFGPPGHQLGFPDERMHWVQRRGRQRLYPFVGVPFGRRYELLNSPEGLASFFTVGAVHAMRLNPDEVRVRIARTAAADVLVVARELDEEATGVRLRTQADGLGLPVYVYEVLDPPPDLVLAGRRSYFENLDEVLRGILSPQFDPATMAIVPGPPRQIDGSPGEVEVVSFTPHRIEADTRSPDDGTLVVQRVYLPIYRATVDGEPAPVTVANLHRLAVEVPAGEHRVEIWVDERPFLRSLWGSGAGLAGLLALPWLARGRRRPPDGEYTSRSLAPRAPAADAEPGRVDGPAIARADRATEPPP
jgi:hypothetical protein